MLTLWTLSLICHYRLIEAIHEKLLALCLSHCLMFSAKTFLKIFLTSHPNRRYANLLEISCSFYEKLIFEQNLWNPQVPPKKYLEVDILIF